MRKIVEYSEEIGIELFVDLLLKEALFGGENIVTEKVNNFYCRKFLGQRHF